MVKNKQIQINFSDGTSSTIDEKVYSLILNLENKIKNPNNLPPFWNLSKLIKNLNENFLEFYIYILKNHPDSKSQLYQDLFVIHA